MNEQLSSNPTLSVWWRRSVLLVFVVGMLGLIFMSVQAYRYAPPIPEKVVDTNGKTIFTGQEIETGHKIWPHAKRLDLGSWLLSGPRFFRTVFA
jgi:nitric oxide reductase subunit B